MEIAVHRFGSAHWSVLQHVARCEVNEDPYRLDRDWMRCREDRQAALRPSQPRPWMPSHGTMLAGYDKFRGDAREAAEAGCQLLDHDDWDCLEDLCAANFVERLERIGYARLTLAGAVVAQSIEDHLRNGGSIVGFRWPMRHLN